MIALTDRKAVFVAELTDIHIRVKLGDFGIAKIVTEGTDTYIGSPAYHAPVSCHISIQIMTDRRPGTAHGVQGTWQAKDDDQK